MLPEATTESTPASSEGLPALPFASVPAPAYACDAEGLIVAYNERAALLWGRRPKLNDAADRYCGCQGLLTSDGAPLERAASPTALALAAGHTIEGSEAVIERPDGALRTVLYYVTPLRNDAGEITGASAVLVDVTARERAQRRAHEALQASEANFRGFFDSAAVGAALVNDEGRFINVNDRYCEITGYGRDELLTMSPFQLDHPDDREEDLQRVRRALSDPAGSYHAEKRYIRKDGGIRWVLVAANFIRDEQQRPVQTVAVCLDMSERKRAEDALHESDRLKDEFLATLAHELRNPLAPLKSAAELMRCADARETEWCRNVIDRQVMHMTRLIDDLLDVSRITRDKLELRTARVELEDVINGAIEASRPMLERCEQTLTTELPEAPVQLEGDHVRLTQVFTNLLTNAAKFTESAGTIRLKAAVDGDGVTVSVTDSGVGIASEELSRVFDKFYQSPKRGTRFLGGLGIGLSLVQRLVELHGGRIEARSAGLGHGSEFVVRLPLARLEVQGQGSAQAGPVLERPRRGLRILIVDDNVDGADAFGRLLALMGHDTVMEYDGQSAIKREAEIAPHDVFNDLGMPGKDGFEVCRRLREQSLVRRPRTIALTGWGRKEDLARTAEAGFDAHLVKPVDREVLKRLLAEVARLRAAAGAAAGAGAAGAQGAAGA
jgi:two-component system CheB/CheR fusion protein